MVHTRKKLGFPIFYDFDRMGFFYITGLQDEFDKNHREGRIINNINDHNATDQAVLAYILLAQTGNVNGPLDERKVRNSHIFLIISYAAGVI